jgi:hypothetical protein
MSNTVRRPRQRPRRRSCEWKTFGWLLRRVAAIASYQEWTHGAEPTRARAWLCTARAATIARYVATLHGEHPESRCTRGFRG